MQIEIRWAIQTLPIQYVHEENGHAPGRAQFIQSLGFFVLRVGMVENWNLFFFSLHRCLQRLILALNTVYILIICVITTITTAAQKLTQLPRRKNKMC